LTLMVRRVTTAHSVQIPGPVGSLEALIEYPEGQPKAIAVICHPHPRKLGTMHNKVTATLARTFSHLGAVAVRFNFRGVGHSEGNYADGVGERDDALAVVQWIRQQRPGLALYLGGFSFGAVVALTIAAGVGPRGLVTVAPPVGRLPSDFLAPTCPWLLVLGDRDEVVSPGTVIEWLKTLKAPPTLTLLNGVGHFFHGQLGALAERVTEVFGSGFGRVE
jgi:hypothetical protein